MTIKDLSKIYKIKREIKLIKKILAAGMSEQRPTVLASQLSRSQKELQQYRDFIANIDDPLVRAILTARCEEGCTWVKVAMIMGYSNEATARMMASRYLKRVPFYSPSVCDIV